MSRLQLKKDRFEGVSRLGKLTWDQGVVSADQDLIATETPIALVYNGVSHAVMMATPEDLEDFALGFSISEGILQNALQLKDLEMVKHEQGIEVQLSITQEPFAALKDRRRNLAGRTGCGICGVEALEQLLPELPSVAGLQSITHKTLQDSMASLLNQQPINASTGAVHAAAWCDISGKIQIVREDVGRHNALDKVIGALFRREKIREQKSSEEGFLLVTSRASYEMVAKSARAGIGLLAAVSAPTSLAIDLAENCEMTLVGFTRAGRHVVYTHPERLTEISL